MTTEYDKMLRGDWHNGFDPTLEALRQAARRAVFAHNSLHPDARGGIAPALAALFADPGHDCRIETPFHTSYGCHISLGDSVYLNAGCVILDSAPVRIGSGAMLGPGVQIYCADHHRDPARRAAGVERALPVTVGPNVWIGGGAILLPGVTIGAGAIVAAGAVVTRDVAPGATVVGAPAQPLGTAKSDGSHWPD